MPRILGVDVPGAKRVCVALTYIHGIGPAIAREILKATDINESVRANDLNEDELSRLGSHIEKNYTIEGQLRRQEAQNINRLREIKCYRGSRHRAGLPVRGQRTKTNARTRKGPRKTVAGKKGVKDISRS